MGWDGMEISGDEIAQVVLKEFESWPQKRKPINRGDGVKEWVPLAGIVAQGNGGLKCLSAATGMKCLPQNKIHLAKGVVLHDWHAEILTIRSFNLFLLKECQALALSKQTSSEYIRLRSQDEITPTHFQPFALNDEIKLHMYCSEAPCGDASMELTIASQDDPTPWDLPHNSTALQTSTGTGTTDPHPLHGRGYFSHLGVTRLKPSRPDAPPTLSKSCSDKLTLKQSTSLLSSLTSLLLSPQNLYLTSLTLPSSQHSPTGCSRSFSQAGRLTPLTTLLKTSDREKEWASSGYKFTPFQIKTTILEFPYSRRQNLTSTQTLISSNISTFSLPASSPPEISTLINGTLQGRKQFSPLGASSVCKKKIWRLCVDIAILVGIKEIESILKKGSYRDVKEGVLLEGRRMVKDNVRSVLDGWVRNAGGEEFSVEDEVVEKKGNGKRELLGSYR